MLPGATRSERQWLGTQLQRSRWRSVDQTGKRNLKLHCPIGAAVFASARVHGLRVPSDSDSVRQRPVRRLQRLRLRLAASGA